MRRRARNGNDENAPPPRRARFGNLEEIQTSNAWRNYRASQRNAARARTAAVAEARGGAPRVPRRPPNVAQQMATNTSNRIALVNTLSAMSNANLLARLAAPNAANIELILRENNANLLRRVRFLQGRRNNVMNINILTELRRLNNNGLQGAVLYSTPVQLQHMARVANAYNANLRVRMAAIMGRVMALLRAARARPRAQRRN